MNGLQKFKYHIFLFKKIIKASFTDYLAFAYHISTVYVIMNNIRTTSKKTHQHLLGQTTKNMLIRIDTPSAVARLEENRHVREDNVRTILLGDIEDAKQIVQYSKIVLSDSRRQQKSP